MKKTKERGITLIALVVTIIVLLILAGVTISLVLGQDGIFRKAEVAAQKTNEGQELDQVRLAVLEARTNNIVDKTDLKTELENSINKVYPGSTVDQTGTGEDISYTITLPNGNTYEVDSSGNARKTIIIDTVKIPEGFHHVTGNTREEGIVVADATGDCEYVWIPVTKDEEGNPTKPYEETNGLLNGRLSIQLKRQAFGEYDYDLTNAYIEETPEEHQASGYATAVAEDITKFKESVIQNGGYFFGRYEVGIEGGTLNTSATDGTRWIGGTLVCKAGQQVWNCIEQYKASQLCRNIDTEKGYIGVTSDLINSYSWDTAITYIQRFGTNTGYANKFAIQDEQGPFKTGEQNDKQCNIYDMSGNCQEWSTETFCHGEGIGKTYHVYRGGAYNTINTPTKSRSSNFRSSGSTSMSFRPILYWNV